MLPFPAIRRELHRLAVAAMKRLIDVQHRLYRVLTRRHILQIRNWIARRARVDHHHRTRL